MYNQFGVVCIAALDPGSDESKARIGSPSTRSRHPPAFGLITSTSMNSNQVLLYRIIFDDRFWRDFSISSLIAADSHSPIPPLRIASHNVAGLTSPTRVHSLVHFWHTHALDIICIQETWTTPAPSNRTRSGKTENAISLWLHAATNALHIPAYNILWATTDSSSYSGNNGVAIIYRPHPNLNITSHSPSNTGRLQTVLIAWGGHNFLLANSYWPSTGPSDRSSFLTSTILPAIHNSHPILLGDFNFVPQPILDRLNPCATTSASDLATQSIFSTSLSHLSDAFRISNPTRHAFTFRRGTTQARLDRIYIPHTLAPYQAECHILYAPDGDHDAVVLNLRPVHPIAAPHSNSSNRPIPHHLPLSPTVAPHLAAWALRATTYGLTLSHSSLLSWWPCLQHSLTKYCRTLVHINNQHTHHQRTILSATQLSLDISLASLPTCTPRQMVTTLHSIAQDREIIHTIHSHSPTLYTTPSPSNATPIVHSALTNIPLPTPTPQVVVPVPAHANVMSQHHTNTPHLLPRPNPPHPSILLERPSPALTPLLHGPKPPSHIPLLLSALGQPLTSPTSIASRLNGHYAAIGAPRPTVPASQNQLLLSISEAITAGTLHPIDPFLALSAGSALITTEEVLSALQRSNPSSSQGPGCIPFTVWRTGNDCMAPLIANLFSAIGDTGTVPPDFNLGSITPILKPDCPDPSHPSAYRPITLLSTLYRLLSRILADRFATALAGTIGPEHTGFLPHRLIDDNILFSSLLPQVLATQQTTGVTFYIDISKAFDTVDREFLFRLMDSMGASHGMTNWAKILLEATYASTHTNGSSSTILEWFAGVRQGCPLSPILYLFIAQALSTWLQAQPPLGITIDGLRFVSTHHADDTQIHLQDFTPQALEALRNALTTYSQATGQEINPAKSSALIQGLPLPSPPPSLAGIPLKQEVISLGIPQSNPPPIHNSTPAHPHFTRISLRPRTYTASPIPPLPHPSWAPRFQLAHNRTASISSLPISAFGMCTLASSYSISILTYHSQFMGLPSSTPPFLSSLHRTMNLRIPQQLLTGHPSVGGFGLLPLEAHTSARHAALATTLLFHLLPNTHPTLAPQPVWIPLATSLLHHACPTLHPVQTLLSCTFASALSITQGILGHNIHQPHRIAPGILTHMASALQALGPPSHPDLTPNQLLSFLTTPTLSSNLLPTLFPINWNPPPNPPTYRLPPPSSPCKPLSQFPLSLPSST